MTIMRLSRSTPWLFGSGDTNQGGVAPMAMWKLKLMNAPIVANTATAPRRITRSLERICDHQVSQTRADATRTNPRPSSPAITRLPKSWPFGMTTPSTNDL